MEMASSVEAAHDGNVVNLLWTGGWDSTFRLMSLITNYSCQVQPYYLIDPIRRSWKIEIETIEKIMEACAKDSAKYKGSILQPVIVDREHFSEDMEIQAMFEALKTTRHVGSQITWLACFTKKEGIKNLEIGAHREDTAHFFLDGHVIEYNGFPTKTFILGPNENNNLLLYKDFEFPLFDMTKTQMESIAREQNFSEIMEMTWFCFQPLKGVFPCGICNPCQCTIEEGMGRRVGWRGRIRYAVYHIVHPLWARIPERLKRVLRPYLDGTR